MKNKYLELRGELLKRGKTLTDVAKAVGASRTTIVNYFTRSNYIYGPHPAKWKKVKEYLASLGIDADRYRDA